MYVYVHVQMSEMYTTADKWLLLALMLQESVRNMVSRSMPIPQPAVGGSPYSRAVQKFSSISCNIKTQHKVKISLRQTVAVTGAKAG